MSVRRRLVPKPGLIIAVGTWLATSPWWTRRPRALDTVAQALAAWGALTGFPAAVVAARRRRPVTAAGGLALGAVGLGLQRWVRGTAAGVSGAPVGSELRVGHFNVAFFNQRIPAAAATLAALDVDVLVLSEMTHRLNDGLIETGLADGFTHRVDRSRPRADGMTLWSRHPIEELAHDGMWHERIRVRVDHPGGPFVVDGIHTQSPIHHARTWTDDFDVLSSRPAPDEPTVMVGDFNASWTHRRFRELVERGWRDVHRTLGRGLHNSWRIDKRPLPPFVRLDHALVSAAVDVVDVADVDLPGSDHRGFVVTLRRR